MSIRGIRLKRFRGFEEVELPLRPLTVLIGPNSAGKSSFGHALACLAHAHRVSATGGEALLAPQLRDDPSWPLDLGTLDVLRTHGTAGPVEIGVLTEQGWATFGFGDDRSGDLRLVRLQMPELRTTAAGAAVPSASHSAPPGAQTKVEASGHDVTVAKGEGITLEREAALMWRSGESRFVATFGGLRPINMQHETGTAAYPPPALLNAISALETLEYLRPSRVGPLRLYKPVAPKPRSVGYSGETAVHLLQGGADQIVGWSERDPVDLSAPEAGTDRPWPEKRARLDEAVQHWMSLLGLAEHVSARERADRLLEVAITPRGREVQVLPDVGFGLSQVLPVIVAGLSLPPGGTLIVELPEAHLHPVAECGLAEFLVALSQNGRQILVETHSEALIRQLRRLVRAYSCVADATEIYCVDSPGPGECCRAPRPLVSPGSDPEWPLGFRHETPDLGLQMAALAREGSRP